MAHFICKMNGDVMEGWGKGQVRYLIWSTVVDAPITHGMDLEELKGWLVDNGEDRDFEARMSRVEAKGTSSIHGESFEELVRFNRAGPKETCLSLEQLVGAYWEPSRL